jgi:excisionase family DNA binding protein
MSPGQWLTVREVAEELQVTEETVRRWIRAGELEVLELGGPRAGCRIRRDELERFIKQRYGRLGKIAA